jgi:uncharacterized protein
MTNELICPKCHETMRTYERNRAGIDQCTRCRGVFLDRGELDRLMDAENAYYRASESPLAGTRSGYEAISGQGSQHGSKGDQGRKSRRRESFLGDLFDQPSRLRRHPTCPAAVAPATPPLWRPPCPQNL